MAIIVAGAFAFKGSGEEAVQAVTLIGFFAGLAVYLFLDERARRREKNPPQ